MEDDLSAWKRTPGNSERRAMNLRVRMRLSRPGFDRHDDIPENGAVHLDTCDKPCSRQLSGSPFVSGRHTLSLVPVVSSDRKREHRQDCEGWASPGNGQKKPSARRGREMRIRYESRHSFFLERGLGVGPAVDRSDCGHPCLWPLAYKPESRSRFQQH